MGLTRDTILTEWAEQWRRRNRAIRFLDHLTRVDDRPRDEAAILIWSTRVSERRYALDATRHIARQARRDGAA
jgi:hypothetical protein